MEHEDYENANEILAKTRSIFNYLIVSLDDNYQLSRDLSEMYMFFNTEIIRASSMKSTKYIDEILPMVKDLRNTWAEADKIARKVK